MGRKGTGYRATHQYTGIMTSLFSARRLMPFYAQPARIQNNHIYTDPDKNGVFSVPDERIAPHRRYIT